MSDETIRAAFHGQAEACRRLGAPFTGAVVDALGASLDRSSAAGRRTLDWESDAGILGDAVPLRLAGAFHYLARTGQGGGLTTHYADAADGPKPGLGEALAAAIRANDALLADWLDRAPQTNEVGRSGVLYAGLMEIASRTGLPLALYEVGASAGLNLIPDRYGYTLGGQPFGDPESPVQITPDWTGPRPNADEVRVLSRRGADLAPVDATNPEAANRMLSYIWPDQPERISRIEAALGLVQASGLAIEAMDAAAFVEAAIEIEPAEGVVRVLQHSIAHQYFPEDTKLRIADRMARAGARATANAPLAWLAFEQAPDEPPTLCLTLWPGGQTVRLAEAHPHGRDIRWLEGSERGV